MEFMEEFGIFGVAFLAIVQICSWLKSGDGKSVSRSSPSTCSEARSAVTRRSPGTIASR